MIYKDNSGRGFISDLIGDPSYCHAQWDGPDYRDITIVSASGSAEVQIEWEDIPALVADLLLLYEMARAANSVTTVNGANVPVAPATRKAKAS